MVSIISTTFFEIPQMDINNIRPILSNGIKSVIKGALETCTFLFLQTVVLTMVLGKFERKDSPFKVYIKGLLIGGIIIFIISLTNILTLGINGIERYYFPSHITASRINIRNALQRIEILPSIILTIGTFIKISIYMIAACKGITKIFSFKDYRFIVVPMSLLMINLSSFEFENMIEYYKFADVWYWYAFPFEVILPIIIWIPSEIKKNRGR
nr:GerAB/ArcD/ProY family transporter [Crassaminicella profunda]